MKRTIKDQEKILNQTQVFDLGFVWRKVRDSNPRTLAGLQFSRLTPSTTLPTFRMQSSSFADGVSDFLIVAKLPVFVNRLFLTE